MKKISLFLLQFICICIAFAQTKVENLNYNPHDFFVENFAPPAGNLFRSAKGVPGPAYWQNSASYVIHATLSEKDTSITGDVIITYKNNSPDKLEYLWLQLDQNIFKSNSRAVATTEYPGDYSAVMDKINGGYQIKDVSVTYQGKNYKTLKRVR